MPNPPRVTAAIPLHRSLPWIDNIVANVRALPPMVTEVLVSDRTAQDDAADVLRIALADDPRVRVVCEPRGLSWSEHCRLLIGEATGELMVLMPHDDIFPADWVPTLVAALDAHPRSLLAFGALELVLADGVTPNAHWQPQPLDPGEITGRRAIDLYLRQQLGVPFRGVFRRTEMLAAGITVESPDRFPRHPWTVDGLWVLAMALHASIVFDDRTVGRKRVHPDSFVASAPPPAPGLEARVGLTVLRRFGPRRLSSLRMAMTLGAAWGRARIRARGPRS